MAPDELPNFFARNGLSAQDLHACLAFARTRFPSPLPFPIEAIAKQGGCSFTLLLLLASHNGQQREKQQNGVIVQFRMLRHALCWEMVCDAREIYGGFAPRGFWCESFDVGGGDDDDDDDDDGGGGGRRGRRRMQGFGMSMISGSSLSDDGVWLEMGWKVRRVLRGFARFFALGWRGSKEKEKKGRVGRSILARLGCLEKGLPFPWLRQRASRTKRDVENGGLECLPVVLTHGDLIPSNVMIDPESLELLGLVDWAEAEYLPFGMGLYGVEHLLGKMSQSEEGEWRFEYRGEVSELREYFWSALRCEIPELGERRIWRAMLLAREVGIFLWHGIAWDDGNLDRVVNPVDDQEELAYLQAFLNSGSGYEKSML
ncbi:Hypothetical predicted protein [Lecanosticta acicola]|uniref:Aminoglycoside phosphotransferase domain-containing protein n=1 Tax=Lecanosticta acicola TaxID=111012 RepID=A0AAI9E5J8_9PEZI|nr:Hypothetical predicted protein [Lecanosticta acicola]